VQKESKILSLINLAVLISGSGTNLQAIIDAVETGKIPSAKVAIVISNRAGAYGLERAKKHGINNVVLDKNNITGLLETLKNHEVDGIVLAGYLSILPPEVVKEYKNKIINIHPSLLPKYGGKGFYGIKVHEAVLAAGEKESGATAHFVDNGIDTGTMILQKKVKVLKSDTAESLQKKVLKVEHIVLVEAINKIFYK